MILGHCRTKCNDIRVTVTCLLTESNWSFSFSLPIVQLFSPCHTTRVFVTVLVRVVLVLYRSRRSGVSSLLLMWVCGPGGVCCAEHKKKKDRLVVKSCTKDLIVKYTEDEMCSPSQFYKSGFTYYLKFIILTSKDSFRQDTGNSVVRHDPYHRTRTIGS